MEIDSIMNDERKTIYLSLSPFSRNYLEISRMSSGTPFMAESRIQMLREKLQTARTSLSDSLDREDSLKVRTVRDRAPNSYGLG